MPREWKRSGEEHVRESGIVRETIRSLIDKGRCKFSGPLRCKRANYARFGPRALAQHIADRCSRKRT